MRDTVVLAIIAGMGLSLAFGSLLLGSVRAHESYHESRGARAVGYLALAALALAALGVGIVLGLIAMAQK